MGYTTDAVADVARMIHGRKQIVRLNGETTPLLTCMVS